MNISLWDRVVEFLRRKLLNRRWRAAVTCMAGIIVFATTYALILPAITLSGPHPTLEAEETVADSGRELTVLVSAEAEKEERTVIITLDGEGADLSPSYAFDSEGICVVTDTDGKSVELHRAGRLDNENIFDYWFVLGPEESRSFTLDLTDRVDGSRFSKIVEAVRKNADVQAGTLPGGTSAEEKKATGSDAEKAAGPGAYAPVRTASASNASPSDAQKASGSNAVPDDIEEANLLARTEEELQVVEENEDGFKELQDGLVVNNIPGGAGDADPDDGGRKLTASVKLLAGMGEDYAEAVRDAERNAEKRGDASLRLSWLEVPAERTVRPELVTRVGDAVIALIVSEEEALPEGAYIEAYEIGQESPEYAQYRTQAENAVSESSGGTAKAVTMARFFDITIMDPQEGEYEPVYPVQVVITYDRNAVSPENGTESRQAAAPGSEEELSLLHFTGGNAEIVEPDTVESGSGEEALSFTAESFSVYGIVYTVDYTIDVNGIARGFTMPGGGVISLPELLSALSDMDEEEAEAWTRENVTDVSFTDEDLVKPVRPDAETTVKDLLQQFDLRLCFSAELSRKEQRQILKRQLKKDEWVFLSLAPFITEEKLVLTLADGRALEIQVTDAGAGEPIDDADLNNFIGDIQIDDVEETEGYDGVIVKNRNYMMHLLFTETPSSQFSTTEPLVYHVPDGIEMSSTGGEFQIVYDGTSYGGNTYVYDTATNTITVSFSPRVAQLVATSQDAKFTIDIEGAFTTTESHYEFGGNVKRDFLIDDQHHVSVDKTGSYSPDDNKVHYTVTASSVGTSENVVITDTISGTALTLDQDSITVSGNSAPYTVTPSGNGFVVNLDSMEDRETVTVTYTASVDFSRITGKGTVEQTGNTVKITADDDPGEEEPNNVSNEIDYNPLQKSAGEAYGSGTVKTVPWTITVNELQAKSAAGTVVKDTINANSREFMHYSGSGITVTVMDGDQTVGSYTKTWEELGISDLSSAYTWRHVLPDDDDAKNHTYKYVITYTTEVDTTGRITDFQVGNTVDDEDGHPHDGEGTVQPGEDRVTIQKESEGFNAETSDWSISFNVPKNGLKSAVVTDVFPDTWMNVHLSDSLVEDSISITGLLEGESYTIDTSNAGKVIITFYKSPEKTSENQGLTGGEEERTVTVRLTTSNNEEWVRSYPGSTHTNTASLTVEGQVVTDTAESNPRQEGIVKSGKKAGDVEINGVTYPYYKYTLSLYEVSDASFDQNGNLTVTDDYPQEYLRIYPEMDGYWDWIVHGANYSDRADAKAPYTDDPGDGTLTFTLPREHFKKDSNGAYLSVYYIDYYMIVKEGALEVLKAASISAEDHKIPMENTVFWDDYHDSVTVDYEYPVVDKERLRSDPANRTADFKIVINPDKLTLNNGEDMTMTDTAENLSIDYSTLVIETDPQLPEGETLEYYYRGYTGYFTIPDRTKVTITYSARIIGDGLVNYRNSVNMKGFHDETDNSDWIDSSASGNLTINWVLLYKHVYRAMDKPLNGAQYVLTDEDGNPVLYPSYAENGKAGQPVLFETGTIDLYELPDQSHATGHEGETNIRDGYAWVFLDRERDGLALVTGQTYYFREYKAPDGYQKSDEIYTFTIADHPDYDDYEYYKGDVMRFADSPERGVLEIRKTLDGAEALTDTQKKQITFTVSGVDKDRNAIRFPVGQAADGSTIYNDVLRISYEDFEDGVYRLEDLEDGSYTVTETGWTVSGYVYRSTDLSVNGGEVTTVSGEQASAEALSAAVEVSDGTEQTVSYTNRYNPVPALLRVVKKDETGKNNLYGATFRLEKKNASGTYEPVEHASLAEGGKFTIDYDNRETGVKLTDLTPGEYRIIETEAPSGYVVDERPVYFTVAGGAVTVGDHGDNVFSFENDCLEIRNEAEHSYTLTKTDSIHTSMKLSGAEFEVRQLLNFSGGTITLGDPIPDRNGNTRLVTDSNGQAKLDLLDYPSLSDSNVYCVKEVKAPQGYGLSDKYYFFYTGTTAPSVVASLLVYNHSVVSLGNGRASSIVPNEKDEINVYAKKLWYTIDGWRDSDVPPAGITYIEVQLYRRVTDAAGTVVSDAPWPDAETVYRLEKNQYNDFLDHRWEHLPTGDSVNTSNPLTYSYYVKEVVPEGYEAKYELNSIVYTDPAEAAVSADNIPSGDTGNIVIRNSPKPGTIGVRKAWLDDDPSGRQEIRVQLWYTDRAHTGGAQADSTVTGGDPAEVALNTSNDWYYKWERLNPGTADDPRRFFVVEVQGSVDALKQLGYGDPEYTVTLDNAIQSGDVVITNVKVGSDKLKVRKLWLDQNGNETTPAPGQEVTLQLTKKEGEIGGGGSHTVTVKTWNKPYNWLPAENSVQVADGGNVTITIPAGYSSGSWPVYMGYSDPSSFGDSAEIPYDDVLNGAGTFTLSDIRQDTTIHIWNANKDYVNCSCSASAGPQPEVVWDDDFTDVTTEDGVPEDKLRITLPQNGSWEYTWDDLPAQSPDHTKEYLYSVREVDVPAGYEVSYINDGGITTGIIYVKNTESDFTRVSAYKEWMDSEGNVIAAPSGAEVVFTLYEDGRMTTRRITLDGTMDAEGESAPWVATFENLEKYRSDGVTPIEYSVKETVGYTGYAPYVSDGGGSPVQGDTVAGGGTIINKKVRTLTAVKKWTDKDGNELTPPSGSVITITLLKNGASTGRSVVLNGIADVDGEQRPWEAIFTDLDPDGSYSIEESGDVIGYELEGTVITSGSADSGDVTYTVTNRKIETTDIGFSKEWKSNNSPAPWPEGVNKITVSLRRKFSENGEDTVDPDYVLTYSIRKEDLEAGRKISAEGAASGDPQLVVSAVEDGTGESGPLYSFAVNDLPADGTIGSKEGTFIYYVTETGVEGYKDPLYRNGTMEDAASGALDGGVIINIPEEDFALPTTGGPGHKWFYLLGCVFAGIAAVLWFSGRHAGPAISRVRYRRRSGRTGCSESDGSCSPSRKRGGGTV